MSEPQKLKDTIEQLDNLLEEYENKLGLSQKKEQSECSYIYLTKDEIAQYSYEELYQISVELISFSIGVQREINKHTRRFNWADSQLKKLLAKQQKNYSAPSYEERKNLLIQDNEYANKLNELKIKSQMVIDQLNYLPNHIKVLSDKIENFAKGKQYG